MPLLQVLLVSNRANAYITASGYAFSSVDNGPSQVDYSPSQCLLRLLKAVYTGSTYTNDIMIKKKMCWPAAFSFACTAIRHVCYTGDETEFDSDL